MKVHEIESESCKTQNYLNNEDTGSDMRIVFILIGIMVITGLIWFVLSKVNEKIMNYIIFG
jgi:LPXTG-motif cell wall-anchored protein